MPCVVVVVTVVGVLLISVTDEEEKIDDTPRRQSTGHRTKREKVAGVCIWCKLSSFGRVASSEKKKPVLSSHRQVEPRKISIASMRRGLGRTSEGERAQREG